eukprot:CAMPEP_0181311110 /NCGR_PEP_ID=MMETSP1101-20121128/12955_1 /TAXON_ID=46948 /ORGANISM="Rhodomonas abbreviata, Strain Caron Lab Isolate" /LENGTH=111 /DNA_ID=CAMNT_0023417805 /DNA_START=504 /DNA_END=835 /DNA_ORIENTATION=+
MSPNPKSNALSKLHTRSCLLAIAHRRDHIVKSLVLNLALHQRVVNRIQVCFIVVLGIFASDHSHQLRSLRRDGNAARAPAEVAKKRDSSRTHYEVLQTLASRSLPHHLGGV